MITLAVLAAAVWTVTVGRAEAGPATIARQYMCQLPIIGTQSITVSFARPALDTATVGVPTPRLPITATGTLTAAARLVVSFLRAEWAEGTAVGTAEVDSPQGPATKSIEITVPRTDIATGSGPLSVSGFGTLPTMTFSRPGDGEVLATGLTFDIMLLTSGGGQTWLSPFRVTCNLAAGQSDVLTTFRILPVPASTRSPNPIHSTTNSPTPRPTLRSTPTPSPPTGRSARPPSPPPNPSPKPPFLTYYLLWPLALAVVGGLGGGAWWLLRRRLA